jgi:FAD dependent oxidoreductase TIGR03364
MTKSYDLGVVGAGIVGLAHAYLAAKAGLKVAVFDRDHQANGASVRNFGFVTVTGQGAGDTWRRARFSRDVWAELVTKAGIPVCHRGLMMLAHSDEAARVLHEFAASPMGEGCSVLDAAGVRAQHPYAIDPALTAGLASPHELRVDSRTAIPRLAAYLVEQMGVDFHRPIAVTSADRGRVRWAGGGVATRHIVICPGHDYATLYPEVFERHRPQQCKLQMLRLSPPGWQLGAAVMSDLGLVRYTGYQVAPSLPTLAARLKVEAADALAAGIHLIVVQDQDGSLVVGDSHVYAPTVDDFADEAVDDQILALARRTLDLSACRVVNRWVGVYGSAATDAVIEQIDLRIAAVIVTSGTGASTAFGLAQDSLRMLKLLPE